MNATHSRCRSERLDQLAASWARSLQSPEHRRKESDRKTVGTVLSTAVSAAMETTWREDVQRSHKIREKTAVSVQSLLPNCDGWNDMILQLQVAMGFAVDIMRFHDYHLVSHIIWKCCVFSRANSVYFFCFCDWLRWLKILLGLDQNARKHREPQGDTGIPWEYNFVGYLSKTEYRNRWYMVNWQKWSSLRHTNLHRLYQWRCATMHFVCDHWNSDPCQNVSHIPHAESEWVKAITTTFRSCWLVRFVLIFFNGLGMFEIDVTSSLEIESASNDWP